ncbi:MAG TPA: flagellar hook-length control protein FliK [Candidatus Hydrogenedentes bacterium]|nr:flagellar hook-length control protein FliK [Candidatus Hydrogenedentota bacterium]HOV73388.1 flagellar hook-length control protein FliK [Candidatus Hydrogenedentota bacterium]
MLISGMYLPAAGVSPSLDAAFQLQVGHVLQGIIHASDEGLFLIAGQLRVQVSSQSGLVSGQAVTAEVLARNPDGQSFQFRITPQTTASPAPASLPAPGAAGMVETLLQALGSVKLPENAALLLPSSLPPSVDAARAALSFFVLKSQLGGDLRRIAAQIEEALRAGVPLRAETRALAGWLNRLVASEPESFESVLRHWLSEAGAPTEARMARAMSEGESNRLADWLRTDVRAALAQMRNDGALTSYLRAQGGRIGFDEAIGRVLERLTANQLQNLRGTEIPYWVAEVPFAPGGTIQGGLVHFLTDGRRAKATSRSGYATIALDLTTTRLGNLWILLYAGGGECHCRVQATEEAVIKALNDAANELRTSLEKAGYDRATIQIAEWDGDRLRETAALFRRHAGLQVTA